MTLPTVDGPALHRIAEQLSEIDLSLTCIRPLETAARQLGPNQMIDLPRDARAIIDDFLNESGDVSQLNLAVQEIVKKTGEVTS